MNQQPTTDLDELRQIGTLLDGGYLISDKRGIVTQAAAEIERLREVLTECLRVNETDAGDDVRVWAKAMLEANAALAQGQEES